MQTKVFIITLIAIVAGTSCKSSKHNVKRLPGVWQVQPIVIDGKNNDWPSPYPNYDEKAQLGYAYSNDKDNLYVTVETGDLATQMKILREGLTLWIDRTGEQNEVTAINYPIPAVRETNPAKSEASPSGRPAGGSMRQGAGERQDRLRIMLEDRVKAAMQRAKEYSLQGFKSCNLQYPLLEKDSCGIEIRMAIDTDNEFIWEAAIPFKTFYFKNEVTKADKGKPISICIETSAIDRSRGGNNGGGGNAGPRPGGSFMMGPGGMGVGMRMGGGRMGSGRSRPNQSGNDNLMESAYKSTKTWKTFGIAYP